jgi:hypothetical protein
LRTRNVPVLIVSGAEPGTAPTDVAAWLTRPMEVPALLSTLNDAITEGWSRPSVPTPNQVQDHPEDVDWHVLDLPEDVVAGAGL